MKKKQKKGKVMKKLRKEAKAKKKLRKEAKAKKNQTTVRISLSSHGDPPSFKLIIVGFVCR